MNNRLYQVEFIWGLNESLSIKTCHSMRMETKCITKTDKTIIISRKYEISSISSARRKEWVRMGKNSCKRINLWLSEGPGFFLHCFISAQSLFCVPCNSSLLQVCFGLSLLVAGPSLLFVEKSARLHLELLKGHCKYWVLINDLFPSKKLSKMPAALVSVRSESYFPLFSGTQGCALVFSVEKRKVFFYLLLSMKTFCELKQVLWWEKVVQFGMFKYSQLGHIRGFLFNNCRSHFRQTTKYVKICFLSFVISSIFLNYWFSGYN